MTIFEEELAAFCKQLAIQISDEQLSKMNTCYDVLVRENQKMNLTRILDPAQAALKHFADSILPYRVFRADSTLIDVGSGGGFPALPLAIMRPDVHVLALEASEKKCAYMKAAAAECGTDLQVVCGRAEELAQGPMREEYDACTARAVASLSLLTELTAPLVKPGGLIVLYKADYAEELAAAKGAVSKLSLRLEDTISMPAQLLEHHILVFTKTKPTSAQYPRRYAKMKKNPL